MSVMSQYNKKMLMLLKQVLFYSHKMLIFDVKYDPGMFLTDSVMYTCAYI